jgi:alpha-tubulin suppressor-like RCC1 family protein
VNHRLLRAVILGALLALSVPNAVMAQTASPKQCSGSVVEWWGSPSNGLADASDVPVPICVPGDVVQVSAMNSDSYALDSDGTVYAWGPGEYGQLGDGTTANSYRTPVQVQFPPGVQIAWLPDDAMPEATALAVTASGAVYGWGYNNSGELCLGNTTDYLTPQLLPIGAVLSIAGAGAHLTYISAEGHGVYSCGGGAQYALGDGKTANSTIPVAVALPGNQTAYSVYASYQGGGVLTCTFQVPVCSQNYYDWGRNSAGQVGNGSVSSSGVATPYLAATAVTAVSLGGSNSGNGQTFAQTADGSWYGWGSDGSGQLGDGGTANQASPELLAAPGTWADIVSGGGTGYFITPAGVVYAAGQGTLGQIGNGAYSDSSSLAMVSLPGPVNTLSATSSNVDACAGCMAGALPTRR